MKVIGFSGGLSSGLATEMEMAKAGASFNRDYIVVFCNTGKEHDATLDFVHDFEVKRGVPVVWLEYCRENNEHSFRVVNYWSAARDHDKVTPFDEMLEWSSVLPNTFRRICSGNLKVRTIKRYMKSLGFEQWENFTGIRADEADRSLEIMASSPKYITQRFPLIDAGIRKADVNAYWAKQPFTLNIPNHEGNCRLCFLKAGWKRRAIMRQDPASAQWWIDWQDKMTARGVTHDGAQWISGKDYAGDLCDALHPEFDFMKEDTSEPDVPCSCAVGGYRDEQEEIPA